MGSRKTIAALGFLLGAWSVAAQAVTWRVSRTHDAFANTETITVEASGDHGGAFLVQCYEGDLSLFLRIPPDLASRSPNYRFRIDRSATYGPTLLYAIGNGHVLRYDSERYVDASSSISDEITSASTQDLAQIIEKVRSGHELVYQIPPRTGHVYKVSLAGSSGHLAEAVDACKHYQQTAHKLAARAEEKHKKADSTTHRPKELDAQLNADIAAEEKRRKAEQTETGLLDQYVRLIQNQIEQQWIKPPSAHPGLNCVVDVQQIPDGTVISVHVRADRCNGDADVRRSIETAVLKASPLPKPPVPELFERHLVITFRPDQVG